MGYTFCLVLVYVLDVINLCRNISDGVRPFMPPCSLVSLYALTNMSYLCLPSSMVRISSNAMNSLLLPRYMLLPFLVTAVRNLVFVCHLADCTRKCLNILDVNCLPLSCIIFLGLPLIIIQCSNKEHRLTSFFRITC
jgi:hypothetical protein